MIAVIFEAETAEGSKNDYLALAAELRPMLEEIDGFISIECFQSLSQPGKLLSLSLWRDEEAVKQWRNVEAHRQAQSKGRDYIFSNYRLRVATVLRDYDREERAEAPIDSLERHSV